MKYSLSPREIPRAKPEGFLKGSGYISSYFLTQVTIQTIFIKNPALTFLQMFNKFSFPSGTAKKLKFGVNVHMPLPVTCHMPQVKCHMSHAKIFFYKVVNLVAGWSVIIAIYPV